MNRTSNTGTTRSDSVEGVELFMPKLFVGTGAQTATRFPWNQPERFSGCLRASEASCDTFNFPDVSAPR